MGCALYPKGIQWIEDVPWDLNYGLEHATKILSWMENLLGDEMPPSWMWPFDSELEIWFDEVNRKRDAKYGTDSTEQDGEMITNEYSDEFKKSLRE